MANLALDQTSGNVAMAWYDRRIDSVNNVKTPFYAIVSRTGGTNFSANIRLNPALSSNLGSGDQIAYGHYEGLAYHGGYFMPVWADNSNSTGTNPNGAGNQFDIYTCKVAY
jgi:hypothetical protein